MRRRASDQSGPKSSGLDQPGANPLQDRVGAGSIEVGVGAGRLSPEARERLARPAVASLTPPPTGDREGVSRWRTAIHSQWLDGDPSAEACGHYQTDVVGVRCDHGPARGQAGPVPDDRTGVDAEAASWLRGAYCAGLPPSDWRVSPLRAPLHDLPPILVQVSSNESGMADAARLGRRARRVGVDVTLDIWHGLWHAWHYHRQLPEADNALGEIAALIAASRPRSTGG